MRKEVMVAYVPVALNDPGDMQKAVQEVFQGEYESGHFGDNLTILDIGGNLGSFSLWATMRWPGSRIHTYEPNPETFKLLRDNLSKHRNVTCHNVAVYPSDKHTMPFWSRGPGDGEAGLVEYMAKTFRQLAASNVVEVPILHPDRLPDADIIKIDAEGAEGKIVSHMRPEQLKQTSLILMEYQDSDNLAVIKNHLKSGFDVDYEDQFPWDKILDKSQYRTELRGQYYGRIFFTNKRIHDLGKLTPHKGTKVVLSDYMPRKVPLRQILSMVPEAFSDAVKRRIRRLL